MSQLLTTQNEIRVILIRKRLENVELGITFHRFILISHRCQLHNKNQCHHTSKSVGKFLGRKGCTTNILEADDGPEGTHFLSILWLYLRDGQF
jgi:hypothetical protein